jgi:4-aminobutyrate aminotransferase-like enzyme
MEKPGINMAHNLDFSEEIELLDIVGPKAREIIGKDCDIISACAARPYPLVVDSAKGSMVRDVDGKEYIDLVAGIAVMNAGYSNPVIKAAISAQLEKMIHWNETQKLDTYGIQAFEEMYRNHTYPGLGTAKKLSIMHHLELMSRYLDGIEAK